MLTLPKNAPHNFHLLAKPTGAICNLDCEYCFFLAKEQLYPGSKFRMSDELLETYIQQLLESHQTPEVTIAWQGGEPTLMGLEFFVKSIELVAKYQKSWQKVTHTIQTNGIQINKDWAIFLKNHNFLIGLSIDGTKKLHDTYRVDKRGRGTFDQVIKAWKILKKHQVEVNILCTVNAANGDYPLEVYRFFRDDLVSIQETPMIELIASPKQRQFEQAKFDSLPQYCRDCEVRFACNGGCPKNRFIETPDGKSGLNYLCAGYKAFFTHIDKPMRMMADLLRQGRYADEIMQLLAKKEGKTRKPIGFGKP